MKQTHMRLRELIRGKQLFHYCHNILLQAGKQAELASLCTQLDDIPNYLHNIERNEIRFVKGQALHLLRALSTVQCSVLKGYRLCKQHAPIAGSTAHAH